MNARKIIRNNNFLSELVRVIIFLSIDIDISTQYYGFGAQNSNKNARKQRLPWQLWLATQECGEPIGARRIMSSPKSLFPKKS
jgi:hypothetical protein